MKMTAKEHFKAMYRAVRLGRIPAAIVSATLYANRDFGGAFAMSIAIAARRAADDCIQRDLTLRLMIFKCSKTEPF